MKTTKLQFNGIEYDVLYYYDPGDDYGPFFQSYLHIEAVYLQGNEVTDLDIEELKNELKSIL